MSIDRTKLYEDGKEILIELIRAGKMPYASGYGDPLLDAIETARRAATFIETFCKETIAQDKSE